MVSTIPRKASYDGNKPVRPVNVYPIISTDWTRDTLKHALTSMFTEDFNDSTSSVMCFGVPLEIAVGMFKDGVQFVTFQFVGGEDADACWVVDEDFIQELADRVHTRNFCSAFLGE